MTPLLIAVAHGSNKVLKLLIEKGARLKATNKRDENIIHLATLNNRTKTLQV